MPVEVNHIVKVAGARPFAERPELFSEGFLISIAVGPYASLGAVGVRMEHFAADRRKHQPLIRCQVQFDLRPAAGCWRDGTAIGDLALTAQTATGVFIDI